MSLVRAKEGFIVSVDLKVDAKPETKARKSILDGWGKYRAAVDDAGRRKARREIQQARAEAALAHRDNRKRIRGRNRVVKRGDFYAADDPVVKAYPEHFEPADEWVEKATAEPGEIRVNRPRDTDNNVILKAD